MKKILIVDDLSENRYLLEKLLEGNGYVILSASNGVEALALAKKDPPDIIISDILMPVMDGFALCREWNKDEKLKKIPFIFYTATYTDPKDEEFALSLGAARFLVKPQETGVFLGIIRSVLTEHEKGRVKARETEAPDEAVFLKEYNEALVRKLEDKLSQLEAKEKDLMEINAELEYEIEMRKRVEKELRQHVEALEKSNQAIKESEHNFRFLVENSPEAIFIQSEGRFTYLNNTAARLFGGQEVNQLLGKAVLEWIHSDSKSTMKEVIKKLNQERQPVPATKMIVARPDGTIVWTEVTAVPFKYQQADCALMFARDITILNEGSPNSQLKKTKVRTPSNHKTKGGGRKGK